MQSLSINDLKNEKVVWIQKPYYDKHLKFHDPYKSKELTGCLRFNTFNYMGENRYKGLNWTCYKKHDLYFCIGYNNNLEAKVLEIDDIEEFLKKYNDLLHKTKTFADFEKYKKPLIKSFCKHISNKYF